VMQGAQPVFRSPSLWDGTLPLNVTGIGTADLLPVRLPGPQDQSLFGVARQVSGKTRPDEPPITVIVAADFYGVELAKRRFADDLIIGASLIGCILLIATVSQVVIGLRPLRDLQARLTSVRQGESRRLEGAFPLEVMPLVIETNALLDAQDTALGLARTRAADLAHGLKTPLAVMTAQSRSLRRRGDTAIADQLDVQIESMRRHVERELARARSRGAGPTHHDRVDTAASLDRIASAMQMLPRGQALDWQLDLTPSLSLTVDPTDFDELMGNLIDNAHKWARSKVLVQSRIVGDMAEFRIEDDGPGVAEHDAVRVLQRGERTDPLVSGSGLGLAIVSDLTAAYHGTLEIGRSAFGGLAAVIRLPDARLQIGAE
jgi:signal transduction histidine kinase